MRITDNKQKQQAIAHNLEFANSPTKMCAPFVWLLHNPFWSIGQYLHQNYKCHYLES